MKTPGQLQRLFVDSMIRVSCLLNDHLRTFQQPFPSIAPNNTPKEGTMGVVKLKGSHGFPDAMHSLGRQGDLCGQSVMI